MAKIDQQVRTGAGAVATEKFSEMSMGGKLKHIGKVILFICSFGFAFPTLFSD